MKRERAVFSFASIFLVAMLSVAAVRSDALAPATASIYAPVVARGYPCYSVDVHLQGNATEYRLTCAEQHFLTVIHENGLIVLRPHPGRDVNGWGSSWYVQPYVRDTSSAHSIVENVIAYPDRVRVSTSGQVSIGAAGDYGTWQMTLDLTYDSIARQVSGVGTYHIDLDGDLSSVGDLKLHKLASNYLIDVPLLSGGRGNTGDTSGVIVTPGDGSGYPWMPVRDHCPQDKTNKLSIDVLGAYNEVDTAAQGHPPIEPAYKPGLKVVLDDTQPAGAGMIFCGFYDRDWAQFFWLDNVGAHAIVRPDTAQTVFDYNVVFESRAAADECARPSTCLP
jgi:hypothetical protein